MKKVKQLNGFALHWYFIAVFVLLLSSSCNRVEEDNQPPKIIVIQPTDGQAFSVGTDFLVVTVMHDYVALDTYSYEIYWYDDPSNISDNPGDPAFQIAGSGSIVTSDSAPHWEDVNFRIDIPTGIRKGKYNLDIYCFDKSGNSYKKSLKLVFQD